MSVHAGRLQVVHLGIVATLTRFHSVQRNTKKRFLFVKYKIKSHCKSLLRLMPHNSGHVTLDISNICSLGQENNRVSAFIKYCSEFNNNRVIILAYLSCI